MVTPISDNRIFVNSQSNFAYFHEAYFPSIVDNKNFSNPAAAYKDGYSAKDYFLGMAVSEQAWDTRYSQYFN